VKVLNLLINDEFVDSCRRLLSRTSEIPANKLFARAVSVRRLETYKATQVSKCKVYEPAAFGFRLQLWL